MAHANLVAELQRAGHATAADNVRHMCIPGQTIATLAEIADYFGAGRSAGAAQIIRAKLDREAAEVAERGAADAYEAKTVAIALIGEDRVPTDVLEGLVCDYSPVPTVGDPEPAEAGDMGRSDGLGADSLRELAAKDLEPGDLLHVGDGYYREVLATDAVARSGIWVRFELGTKSGDAVKLEVHWQAMLRVRG